MIAAKKNYVRRECMGPQQEIETIIPIGSCTAGMEPGVDVSQVALNSNGCQVATKTISCDALATSLQPASVD